MFKVPEVFRVTSGPMGTDSRYGRNGVFFVKLHPHDLRVICSDGGGWEHVSVSVNGESRCPTWEEMCLVKSLFWDEEDCVVQYHPPKSEYVNCHPYVLHLWRPMDFNIPTPPSFMVGPKR